MHYVEKRSIIIIYISWPSKNEFLDLSLLFYSLEKKKKKKEEEEIKVKLHACCHY